MKFAELVGRFLGAQIENLGYIPMDRLVREGVKRQLPFVKFKPTPKAGEAIELLAKNCLSGNPYNNFSFFERVLMFRTQDLK